MIELRDPGFILCVLSAMSEKFWPWFERHYELKFWRQQIKLGLKDLAIGHDFIQSYSPLSDCFEMCAMAQRNRLDTALCNIFIWNLWKPQG